MKLRVGRPCPTPAPRGFPLRRTMHYRKVAGDKSSLIYKEKVPLHTPIAGCDHRQRRRASRVQLCGVGSARRSTTYPAKAAPSVAQIQNIGLVYKGEKEDMGTIESAIFDPNPDDRIRILVEHKGVWKALFWIKVSKDGSIYLSPRYTNPKILKTGKSVPNDNGLINIKYSEGVKIKDLSQANKAKMSFHASGIINFLNMRTKRNTLRNLAEQEQLCTMFFQYPGKFDTIPTENLKKRDICLRYPIEEDYPIFMHVFVAPTPKFQLVDMGVEKHQVNLVLQYNNIENIGDFTVQLSIFAPAKGEWPPYTYVIYQTNEY